MTKHAILSPSGFKALMLCPAKPAMEHGRPDESSEYADEGTAAHFLGSTCLEQGAKAADYLGRKIFVHPDYDAGWWENFSFGLKLEGRTFTVDQDMVDAVQVYIDTVRDFQADGELFVEQALPIGHITGEEGAEGTGDAVIISEDEITVIDLKYGKGVEVDAFENPQLMLYGLGALEKFDMVGDFDTVRMVICQPRVSSAPSEWSQPAPSLVEWGLKHAGPAAQTSWDILHGDPDAVGASCRPHPDACRFCKAKGDCQALARSVETALEAEFTDLTTADQVEKEAIVKGLTGGLSVHQLGAKMDSVELVEMWCKAIRARVEGALLEGQAVAGYKLVAGKKGARAWANADEAEKVMKSMRLKREEMYEEKLISPTSAEKILKASPKRWNRIAPLITQSDGKPSVAPVSDKRPALEVKPVEAEFTAITEGAEDLV